MIPVMTMTTMPILIGILFLLQVVSVVVAAGNDNSTSLDTLSLLPTDYFGGSDHEPYLTWYNENGTRYTGCLFLEAVSDTEGGAVEGVTNRNGVAVHWRVDETQELLYLSFAARAQDGWIGFGMAEAGGMSGADLVIYETSKPDTLTDAYVLRTPQPLIDDCQDWQFISSRNDGGFLIVEGVRKFDTKDTQDRVVINDAEQYVVAQKVIAAWSNESDTMMYHGTTNRARGSLRWFGTESEVTSFQRQMAEEATGYFDLSFGNYSIKAVANEYVKFCFDWSSDVVSQGLAAYGNVAMIAIDIVAEKNIQPFLHHISFLASQQEYNASSGTCRNPDDEQYLYGWTFGSSPFRLPSDVGFVIGPGEKDGFQGFRLEVHYYNPNLIEGIIDNSKLRIYYSSDLRKYEVGVAMMADFAVELRTVPIDAGISKYNFQCSDQCSVLALDEPVTVVAEAFHMHSTGSAGLQYQIRNGEIIRRGVVDYFDFDQSGTSSRYNDSIIISLFHDSHYFSGTRITSHTTTTISNTSR